MELDHAAHPSEENIPAKRENTSKRRSHRRWWWLLIIPATGGIVILAVFFPQVMGAVGLAVLSAIVASVATWLLERFFKGK